MTFSPSLGRAADAVLLRAAGSLRSPLTEVARAFEAAGGAPVTMKFGASGLLRDEIAGRVKAEVFASANMEHPRSLAEAKRSGPVVLFARNRLCALARPGLEVTTANVIDRMLDPQIKLGTSTPKADPSGDYSWKVFRGIDNLRAGSLTTLEVKALQLTGGPTSPKPPLRINAAQSHSHYRIGRGRDGTSVQRPLRGEWLTSAPHRECVKTQCW